MKKIILAASVLILTLTACDDFDMYIFAKYGPKPDKVYLFMRDTTLNGDMGGREGADKLCQIQYDNSYSDRGFFVVKAFLSVSSKDIIRDLLPEPYWDTPVYGIHSTSLTETLVSSSWKNLWDDDIEASFNSSLGVVSDWWSGSTSSGGFDEACNGWTSSTGVYAAVGTNGGYLSSTWIHANSPDPCNYNQHLVCMGY